MHSDVCSRFDFYTIIRCVTRLEEWTLGTQFYIASELLENPEEMFSRYFQQEVSHVEQITIEIVINPPPVSKGLMCIYSYMLYVNNYVVGASVMVL